MGSAIVVALAVASSALRAGMLRQPDSDVPTIAGGHPMRQPVSQDGPDGSATTDVPGPSIWFETGDESPDVATGEGDGMRLTSYESFGGLESTSRELVRRYRDEADCLLRQAGYLDLLGDVWSCVMEGPGWVDVCVVREGDRSERCTVSVMRMEAEVWEKRYGQ